jgi:hypothetical protein
LIVTGILIGIIAGFRTGPAATAVRESLNGVAAGSPHVAKPESMKQFPPELIPMP